MPFEHNCNNHAGCDHEPTSDDGSEWNLNTRIDLENLQCLNEEVDGSCKKIFRAWDDRLNREHVTLLNNYIQRLFSARLHKIILKK